MLHVSIINSLFVLEDVESCLLKGEAKASGLIGVYCMCMDTCEHKHTNKHTTHTYWHTNTHAIIHANKDTYEHTHMPKGWGGGELMAHREGLCVCGGTHREPLYTKPWTTTLSKQIASFPNSKILRG